MENPSLVLCSLLEPYLSLWKSRLGCHVLHVFLHLLLDILSLYFFMIRRISYLKDQEMEMQRYLYTRQKDIIQQCYDLMFVSPQNSYVEMLTPNAWILRGNQAMSRALMNGIIDLQKRPYRGPWPIPSYKDPT